MSEAELKKRAREVFDILNKTYPEACCSLDYKKPHELMVATILAAQCTDERVNKITPDLFKKYPDVYAFASAVQEELEEDIKSSGFYRNKAKNIILSAKQIVSDFNGEVPGNMEDLLSLSGIGRKTANLLLGDVFGVPSVVVDTHVKRISKKLGLTKNTDPEKIEFDLRKILTEDMYTHFNHVIVFHGRAICKAPTPKCEICPVRHLCPTGGFLEKEENTLF